MEDTNRASFDIESLTKQCFPGVKTAVLKDIAGGQSGAVVLLVDLTTDTSAGATGGVPSGQYILKVQLPNPWPGEAQEAVRHSEAQAKSSAFGANHIPALVFSDTVDGTLLLLYDVAGHSLASFVAADTVDAGALRHYSTIAARDLWMTWNSDYFVNTSTSAQASLRRWLGYRLDAAQAPELQTFVAEESAGKNIFRMADRVLVNPLTFATNSDIDVPVARVSFDGMIHGDLHLGNILVDRTLKRTDEYWLIDFALARAAPLGFDQAYLELSILIGLLQGVEPQRMLNILEALDATDDPAYSSRVPVSDVGTLEMCKGIREANAAWQLAKEPKRIDTVVAQLLLSRIAAGLNWVNKPLPKQKRRLALSYAAWAATRYFALFNPAGFASLLSEGEQPNQGLTSRFTPAWREVWEQLGRFDSTRARYVLIAERLDVSKELLSLGLLPWSAIVDLDPASNEHGLHSAIGKTLAAQRSVNQYGLNAISIDAERGTAWFMARGWPSRHEPVPADFRRWRSDYGESYRQLLKALQRAAAPLPVKVLILTGGLNKQILQSLIDMADESLGTSSDITLVGPTSAENDPAVKACYAVPVDEFLKALYYVFGASIDLDEPAVPSTDGLTALNLDQLRNLEEDLDVLHSNVLKQAAANEVERATDAFWKGNPPSWSDLHADVDVRRALAAQLLKKVTALLKARGNYTVELRHAPGSGGTTAALRCGWDLRREFPVAVLRQYSTTTADRIDQLFRISQKPVLLIADAAILPPAQREDLYREIAKRNVRCVILYVARTFGEQLTSSEDKSPTERLEITEPMSDEEASAFLRVFAARTKKAKRRQLLSDLANVEAWKPYRIPFFFGLTTYEDEFESVPTYVEHHLNSTMSDEVKKVVRVLALVTKYSQTGITTALLNKLLRLDPGSDADLRDSLGEGVHRLVVRRGQLIRLLHPVIAQEVLRQSLGGEDWKYGLRDLCLEFITETARHVGTHGAETLHLFTELFIRRDYWTPSVRRRRNFSELILDIPTPAGQHQVLKTLTETCPDESHFWNHLGRHHIYEMKQDFAEAERYLKKAITLSEYEQVHHHSLGMVRRFWIRSLIAEMLRRDPPPTAEYMFDQVHVLFLGAAEDFAAARVFGPEDQHGYITHIQLILEVLENLVRLDSGRALPAILSKSNAVGAWARASTVVAEDLLRQVRQLRQQETPSRYELSCTNDLAALYGHFDAVISSLETLSKSVQDPDVRRALATAYFSKSGRVWANLTASELRRTKDLMEDNLRADPTNDRDIRSWFQAFRRLPEFSYIDAIDRLEAWATASNQVDAYYYLYILHFLRWWQGAERDESAMRVSLDQCRQRSIGKRGLSYEWLAKEPAWCPLAHATELGEWTDFWENPEPLEWITGSIATIKPQAGTIRLGPRTLAYFVPGTKFSETRHLNALVKCRIGFSYEGLRAWEVDFVTEETATSLGDHLQQERATAEVIQQTPVIDQVSGQSAVDVFSTPADKHALTQMVERFVQDRLTTSVNRDKPLHMAELGNQLLQRFGKPPIYGRLGFATLKDFLRSLPSAELVSEGTTYVVKPTAGLGVAANTSKPAARRRPRWMRSRK